MAIRRRFSGRPDSHALVQSDMRAHMNPLRMNAIAIVARRLASRLLTHCRECDAPGFGIVRRETGLPCGHCGMPTSLPSRDVLGCARCEYEVTVPHEDGRESADPRYCEVCNP